MSYLTLAGLESSLERMGSRSRERSNGHEGYTCRAYDHVAISSETTAAKEDDGKANHLPEVSPIDNALFRLYTECQSVAISYKYSYTMFLRHLSLSTV